MPNTTCKCFRCGKQFNDYALAMGLTGPVVQDGVTYHFCMTCQKYIFLEEVIRLDGVRDLKTS
jgi:hypothetical protein